MLPSSSNTTIFKWGMNLYPMFFGTGGRIQFISKDWKHIKIKLSRNIWSYNFVGTIFGGSMFAASDPFYMLMYYHILGRNNYVVWDKSASIKFVAPGKSKLYAEFKISDEEIAMVKEGIKNNGFIVFDKTIEWKDIHGKVHAVINRSIYAASKEFYNNRKKLVG
jgi:hypothetical protein